MVFQTPINPVRQRTQTLIKEDLAKVGIDVNIRRVISEDFFSADPAQTRSLNHFYADMQEYNAGSDTPDPAIYMSWWLCSEIASIKNQWQKPNNARYCNPEYDKLWKQASQELDPAKRADIFAQMNTLLMRNVAVIPLVRRAVVNAVSDRLESVDPTPWDASTWDIGTWRLAGTPALEESSTDETLPAEAENADVDSQADSQAPVAEDEATKDKADDKPSENETPEDKKPAAQ